MQTVRLCDTLLARANATTPEPWQGALTLRGIGSSRFVAPLSIPVTVTSGVVSTTTTTTTSTPASSVGLPPRPAFQTVTQASGGRQQSQPPAVSPAAAPTTTTTTTTATLLPHHASPLMSPSASSFASPPSSAMVAASDGRMLRDELADLSDQEAARELLEKSNNVDVFESGRGHAPLLLRTKHLHMQFRRGKQGPGPYISQFLQIDNLSFNRSLSWTMHASTKVVRTANSVSHFLFVCIFLVGSSSKRSKSNRVRSPLSTRTVAT